MSDEFDRGVMIKTSWHMKEKIRQMITAEDMITAAEECGSWPIELVESEMTTNMLGLPIPWNQAIIAKYTQHPARVVGFNGERHRPTTPEEWRKLIHAAVDAGAKPDGCFTLREGRNPIACFQIGDTNAGKAGLCKSYLLLADCYDGTSRLICGLVTIRVVCMNTLSVALKEDGLMRIRHSASAEEKIKDLQKAIPMAIKMGISVAEAMRKASEIRLHKDEAEKLFDELWPKADKDAAKAAITRANNKRAEARQAMLRPENRVGHEPGMLATMWNAATFLVDREPNGQERASRTDAAESMLLPTGTRGKRIQEIQTIIEVYLKNGELTQMTQHQAQEAGVPGQQIGRAVIADLLDGEPLS